MNMWSRLLLHLRRARLRQRYMKQQVDLRDEFKAQLLTTSTADRTWHDIEWLTEPLLHVHSATEAIPVALVGIAAIYSNKEGEQETFFTQAGTALFYYEEGRWLSQGKVLLNLTPAEALRQLADEV